MLTRAELENFARDGFIVKRSLLSPELCRQCLKATWEILADQEITDDPKTWGKAHKRRGVIKLRDEISDNAVLLDAITNCKGVTDTVTDLMGPDFINCGVRGVYPTLPIPRRISRPYEPHIEHHPCQIVVMFYLDHVTTSNGGLFVWPGSHVPIYTENEKKFVFSPKPGFINTFRKYNSRAPFELTGNAGDVLFFHHRLFHSGSNNFGNSIRFGVLNDFIPSNYDDICDEVPTQDNMWDYWSMELKEAAGKLQDISPVTETKPDMLRKLLIQSQRTIRLLKGSYADEYEEKIAKLNQAGD